uniref:Thioredoxin domain-containing protein n=1 Tax=Ananas comosus var. bracteatus TaxID=296719 RepID=A0A6V7QCP9_ANACO|nr:unnamed protein product [Ananas comosus var. bracteatus]
MASSPLITPAATTTTTSSSSSSSSSSLRLSPSPSATPHRFPSIHRTSAPPRRIRLRGALRNPSHAQRLPVRCAAAAAATIGEGEFAAAVLESELPVLVEFVAEWCGPCRLISPVVDWASQEYKGKLKVVKIDHDANPQLIEEYKVYGLPTLILFKNGKEVPESRREGAMTKVKLKEYLDDLLEPTTVA